MSLDPAWYNALVNDDGSNLLGTQWTKAVVGGQMATINAALGLWTDIPYSAGNFGANGAMGWTVDAGDVLLNRYKITDKQIVWQVQLVTTSLTGTPNTTLRLIAPAAVTFASTGNFARLILPAGGYVVPVAAHELGVFLDAGANWPLGANNVYVYFTFVGQVA